MHTPVSRKTLVRRYPLVGVLILLAAFTTHDALAITTTCRVTTSGTAGGNGADWSTQAMDLPTALATAGCGEIWVAGGIYKPTTNSSDRTASFAITRNLALYGGFAGTETTRAERDPRANPTILSGDIDNNDTGSNGVNADASQIVGSNSYNVVYIHGAITSNTVLDGFIITGGLANGTYPGNEGGGLLCDGYLSTCNPTLSNLTFSGNKAIIGGALCASSGGNSSARASLALKKITYSGNQASGNGGAVAVLSGSGSISYPTFENVTFSNNSAITGGALYSYGSGTVPALNNVTFTGNSAGNGGAIANETGHSTLNNAIVWGNTASNSGAEIFSSGGLSTISDSVLKGSCSGNTCSNVINTDPGLGPLQDNGGFNQTIRPGGSAVDAGNDSTCATDDQRGISRPQILHCDIGALEVVDEIFIDGFDLPV